MKGKKVKNLPNKLYFRIGEVAKILDLEPYVLRYWESEFPSISPAKDSAQRRLYTKKDIEHIAMIKYLLYERRLTIEGARRYLSSRTKDLEEPTHKELFNELIQEIDSRIKVLERIIT